MRRRTASWTAAGALVVLIAIVVSLPRWRDRGSDTAPVAPPVCFGIATLPRRPLRVRAPS